jgi:cell division protein FtsB
MRVRLRAVVPSLVQRGPAFWVASLFLAALVGNATFGDGGIADLIALRAERTEIGHEVFDLLRENERLHRRIHALRESPRTLERLARSELGLVRPGEIVYRFSTETIGADRPDAVTATAER